MTDNLVDVLDEIDRSVLEAKAVSDGLQSAWPDWLREIAYAIVARDCAEALKSSRIEALEEMRQRLAAIDDSGVIASGPLAGIDREELEAAVGQMYEGDA